MRKLYALALIPFAALCFGFNTAANASADCTTTTTNGSNPDGTCSYSPYVVSNDQWGTANVKANGTETITAQSAGDWNVQASGVSTGFAYPDVRENGDFTDSVTSTFNITMPTGTYDAEAAYDLFSYNPNNGGSDVETMIWVNNHGEQPWGGEKVLKTNVSFGGALWTEESPNDTTDFVWILQSGTLSSGNLPIGSMLHDTLAPLELDGYGSNPAIQFGWEIHLTSGTDTFDVNGFSITP